MLNLQTLNLRHEGFSQHGEDELLLSLSDVLGDPRHWTVVEFGASRGQDNSNTKLLVDLGAKGLFIEGNAKRFRELSKKFSNIKNLQLAKNYVVPEIGSPNSLSRIIHGAGLKPTDVTVLSIDVDGDDYWHLNALDFTPSVVVIEFNPTVPADSLFINSKGKSYGSSPRAILSLAESRGYFLGAMTPTNLLFLREDQFSHFVKKQDLLELCLKVKNQIRFAISYSGEVLRFSPSGSDTTSEVMDLGWSKGLLVQPLPKFLRQQSGDLLIERVLRRFISVLVTFFLPRLIALIGFLTDSLLRMKSDQN